MTPPLCNGGLGLRVQMGQVLKGAFVASSGHSDSILQGGLLRFARCRVPAAPLRGCNGARLHASYAEQCGWTQLRSTGELSFWGAGRDVLALSSS